MCGICRVVASYERLLYIDAEHIVLTDNAYQLHIRILNQDIVRGVYEIADIDCIAYAGNYPRLLGGIVAVYLIPCAHARQKLDCRCVFIDLVRLHIRLQAGLVGIGYLGILKRRLGGYRKLVYIVLAVLADKLDEL